LKLIVRRIARIAANHARESSFLARKAQASPDSAPPAQIAIAWLLAQKRLIVPHPDHQQCGMSGLRQ